MRKLTQSFLAALLFAGLVPAASAGTLGNEQIISTDANMGSQFPEVAYSGSTIHVVWEGFVSGKAADIYYTRSTNNGSTWSAPVNLTNNATASVGNNRPQVATNGSVVVVGWNSDNNTGAVYTRTSTDSGANFNAAVTAGGVEGGFYSRLTDLMIDSGGNIHVAYYDNGDTAGLSGMVHHRISCNNGASYGTDVPVTSNTLDGVFDNEQPRLAEHGGRIYVVYRSTAKGYPQGGWVPYTLMMKSGVVSGCALTGLTYPARRIAGGLPFSYASLYRPDVFSDGSNLHLAWWDNAAGANVVYRRGNPTTTLGAASTISSLGLDHLEPGGLASTAGTAAGGYQVPPSIVSNGTAAVLAYQRNSTAVTAGEIGPISLRESSDNGGTFGVEQPIASAGTSPRVAISSNNTAVVWSDLRTMPTARIYFRGYSLGPATTPQISVNPGSQDFGSKVLGTNTDLGLTVVNSGTAGTITGVATSGDWSIVSNGCTGAIGAGGSCAVTVRFTPTTIGTRTGTLTVTSSGSTGTASLTGTGLQATVGSAANRVAVIRGFYETILGRTPDQAGVDFWNNEATRVTGLGADVKEVFFALSVQFFNTPEYLNKNASDTTYLTDLYNTFFQRAPDAGGMAFWQSQLNGGMDRGALLTNFLFSTEFANKMTSLFGSPTIRPEINMTIDLYRGILGVLPDSGGFNFWLGQIRAAQCSGGNAVNTAVATIADGFLNSAEYSQREVARPAAERNKRHIGDLYNAFLRRGADLSGYNFWAGQLDSGAQSRPQVRANFISSTEFQGRVSAVISAGCAS